MNEPAGIFERIFEPDLGPKEDVAELHKFAENYKAEKQAKYEDEKRRSEEIIKNYEELANVQKKAFITEDTMTNGIIRKIDSDPSYYNRVRLGLTTNPEGTLIGYEPTKEGLQFLIDISLDKKVDQETGKPIYKVSRICVFDQDHLRKLYKTPGFYQHSENLTLNEIDMNNPSDVHGLLNLLLKIPPELRNIPIPAPSDNEPN